MADDAGSILSKAGFRRLTPLQQKTIPLILAGRDILVEAASGAGKTLAMLTPIVVSVPARASGIQAVLLLQGAEALKKAQRQWKNLARACSSPVTHTVIGADDSARKEVGLLALKPNLLIASPQRLIDHIRQGSVDLGSVRLVAVDAPPQAPEFLRDIEFILSKCPADHRTALFVPSVDDETVAQLGGSRQQVVLRTEDWQTEEPEEPEEEHGAQPSRRGSDRRKEVPNDAAEEARGAAGSGAGAPSSAQVDEEGLKALIKSYLERITEAEDPKEMNRLKQIYRRSVPLHLRGYFAAYLLRELAALGRRPAPSGANEAANLGRRPSPGSRPAPSGANRAATPSGPSQGRGRRPGPGSRPAPSGPGGVAPAAGARSAGRGRAAPAGKAAERKAAPGAFARLFINVGRNRRIFPNDIYDLFSSQLQIPRSDFGEVRILDNYSFVEVRSEHAERVIAELTGKELKGRKLTVNYARPREDKQRE